MSALILKTRLCSKQLLVSSALKQQMMIDNLFDFIDYHFNSKVYFWLFNLSPNSYSLESDPLLLSSI